MLHEKVKIIAIEKNIDKLEKSLLLMRVPSRKPLLKISLEIYGKLFKTAS